jgi:5-methylcytosine-specific restriction endonuclease McrA
MPRTNTRAQRARNKRILAASDVCFCGHPGADAVDHRIPYTLRPDLEDEPSNLRPAHHDVTCPVCLVKCNRVKADKLEPEPMRRTPGIARPV